MSKQQQIIDAIIERMETILVANGYQTDLGQNVADWRVNWQQDELPALSVCDLITTVGLIHEEPTASMQMRRANIQLRIFVAEDEKASVLRQMMRDVEYAIGEDRFWTVDGKQLAVSTETIRSGIIIQPESFEIGGAIVEIEVQYLTNSFSS